MAFSVHRVARTWVLEYLCKAIWNDFIEEKRLGSWHRDLIEEDGAEYETQYTGTLGDETVLERFLNLFPRVLSSLGLQVEEFQDFLTAVKEQAVLVCCRDNDFESAGSVYGRLFKNSNSASDVEGDLEDVLKSKDSNHSLIRDHSYDQFLKTAVAALQRCHDKLGTPFMEKVAQRMLSGRDAVLQNVMGDLVDENGNALSSREPVRNGASGNDFMFQSQAMREVTKAFGETYPPNGPMHRLSEKVEEIHKQTRTDEERSLLKNSVKRDTVASSSRGVTNSSPRTHTLLLEARETGARLDTDFSRFRKTAEVCGYKRNSNRPDRHALLDTSNSDISDASWENISLSERRLPTLDPRRTLKRSISPVSNRQIKGSKRFHHRLKWSKTEEEHLIEGVQRFGKGHWAKIRDAYPFTGRTSVNLKDKWRNLVDRQRVVDV